MIKRDKEIIMIDKEVMMKMRDKEGMIMMNIRRR